MTTKKEVLQVIDKLGTTASLATFEERIRLQKLIYLSEAVGINLGFSYNWHIRGPYSPQLAKVMFEAVSGEKRQTEDASEQEKIQALKNFLGTDIDSSEKLELIGSLRYLLDLAKKDNRSPEHAIDLLCKTKPQFSREEVVEYYNKITANSILAV